MRSDIFVTMVRADAYAALGELEPACATALHALELGHQLRSARPTAYLREFRTRLRPYRNEPAVRAFLEQVAGDPLWRSSRTASPPA